MTSQLKSLNNMVTSMNAQNVCDAECQNKKNIEESRKTFIKAQQNLQNAQPNFDRAEKDYYTLSKGADYYSKMQEAKFKKQAQDTVTEWNTELEETFKDIENKLLYYKGLFSYKDNVKFVYNNYRDKYTSLVDEIEDTTDKKNVNYRLAHFYNYNTTIIKSILWWLKVIYWIFYVIMVVLFILKRQFKNVKSWPFILFAGLFPLLFEYGLSWKNPFKKEISKVPSVYEVIFDTFKHNKIDNIYFISFSLVVLTLLVFSFFSMLPY